MMPGGRYEFDDASRTLHVYPSREFEIFPIDSRGEKKLISQCEAMVIHDGVNELFDWQFAEALRCKKLALPESLLKIGTKCFFTAPIECAEIGKHVSVHAGAFASTKAIKWDAPYASDVLRAVREGKDQVL